MKKVLLLLAVFAVAVAFFIGTARTALSTEDVRPVTLQLASPFDLKGGTPLGSDEPFEEASAVMGPAPAGLWSGDVRINNPSDDVIKPSMTSLPNGDLYMAVEDRPGNAIHVYKSTDGGASWSYVTGAVGGDDMHNPSIAYGTDSSGHNNIYVVHTIVYINGTTKGVMVLNFDVDDPGGTWTHIYVMSGDNLTDDIYPEITTDYLDWPVHYVHVTWTQRSIDYSPVFFSRSTDYGVNWSTPANVTGGSENHGFEVRSDIAYGPGLSPDNLYIVFVKPGWDGSSWTRQIWVTISDDFGSTWSTPVQLTSTALAVYDPRVAAAANVDSVVVAYTKDFGSSSDTDIYISYSTDGGANWTNAGALSFTLNDERSVELSVSHNQGRFHAAFYRDYNRQIYTWADASNPSSWAATTQVNEGSVASAIYTRPAVSVNPTSPEDEEACVAWTDYRETSYDVFFDSPGLVVPNDPVPEITANGSGGPITISRSDNLSIVISLDAGGRTDDADWWIVADTPFAPPRHWYSYNFSNWMPGFSVANQAPLSDVISTQVLNMTGLPAGDYTFHFGVDLIMNGSLDLGQTHYDSVEVTITP